LKNLTITLAQLGYIGGSNTSELARIIKRETLGDIVFLPENWLSTARKPIPIRDYESIILSLYDEIQIPIFGGLNPVIDSDGLTRSIGLAVIDGIVYRVCEKIYPSKATSERSIVKSGKLIRPITIDEWVIGCTACVDIFYPEISRILVVLRSNIIYNPSSITIDRLDMWHSTLRSRAVENIVYTVGVNSTGVVYPDGRITGGSSAVYTPYGRTRVILDMKPRVVTLKLEVEEIDLAISKWAFREDFEREYMKVYEAILNSQTS